MPQFMATYTLSHPKSRVSPLSKEEQASTGCNVRWRVLYTDVAYATATANSDVVVLTLANTPANWVVDNALVNVTTAFAGTTALSLAVGTTSTTTAFVSAQSVKTAGPLEMAATLPILTNAQGTAALSLVATFTNSSGGSPSAITAGQADIFLNVVNMDKAFAL